METDEQAVRNVVDQWLAASKRGDLDAVLKLTAMDVLFLVPGRPPFGRDLFAAGFRQMQQAKLEGASEIQEVNIAGDWAWMRTKLKVTITPPGGAALRREGQTLTILRREPDGRWVIYRDANLLAAM